ncbi:guanylate kinase [Gulosibacter macacae]|uniref:Guanylate kinase n=1 Tax=Gulosibacter macacae TaxID=2488791 RepID=A0A3P3VWU7_9MICO|nr:guanylate kinase [Gulosibacter macacae]RRJ87282.1 guanylate kinase [Gulosibacter macacae]
MSQTPPEVDRVAASKAAVAARRARAAVKQRIASGAARPLDVLAAAVGEHPAASLRVTQFLRAIPHIGITKTERILIELKISEVKRLGGLGKNQRARLEQFLADWERSSGPEEPRVVVLAGPTAVGKGTVAQYIREHYPTVHISVSATTREPRPGEVDGVDYYFVTPEEFDRMIEAGELLEYATVHKVHRYGTPAAPLRKRLAEHQPVLLEIDLQGARQVRERMPEARLVFLLPPSWDELVNRLTGRGTESSEEQARRLDTAKVELAAQDEFDARVVNSTVAEAAQQVVRLMGLDVAPR